MKALLILLTLLSFGHIEARSPNFGQALLIGADFSVSNPRSKLGVVLGSAIESALKAPTTYPVAGKQVFGEVETAYQRGEYDKFLRALDEQYRRAGQAGALRGVFETARTVLQDKAQEFQEAQKEKIAKLDKDRNRRLLEAVELLPNSAIAKTVDQVVFFKLAPQFQDVLSELASLKYVLPKEGGGIAEQISALETEYMIKSHLLHIGNHLSESSKEDLGKKKIALSLEKLSRMKTIAREGKDPVWEEKIATAQLAFRIRNAFQWDLQTLRSLGEGELSAKNPVEENVQQIMMEYLQQLRSLR